MLHFITYPHATSKQWVTFVHGAGGSSSIWFGQLRTFKSHFNVLLLDLRGHGKSKQPLPKQLKKYTFEVIGDDVIEVIDYLNIEKSHFVGISLGTVIIREISERFPERVSSQILGGAIMKLNLRGQFLMRMGFVLKSILPYLILYRFFAHVIMPKKKHRKSRNLFINEAKKLYQKEFKRWFSLVAEVNPILALFRLKETLLPTLFIMGSEDYMFLPSISKLVQNHSTNQLSVIPDCGHVVNVDAPEVFNQLAVDFIQRHS